MDRVLFTSNPPRRCGVHEFGRSTWTALQRSHTYEYIYEEFDEQTDAARFCDRVARWAPVAIIHNWHPATMPWLTDDLLHELQRRFPTIRHAAIVHDQAAPQHWIDGAIFCDPTYVPGPGRFRVGRRLWERPEPTDDPGPVIGSFGFGLGGKGFQRVVEQVNREFDTATVRLHIPYSEYCDPGGERARTIADECRSLAKPGVTVEVTSHYLEREAMLDWLAGNAVNCFFYDELKGRGISSVIDFALSARRPVAITASHMFRHIVSAEPSIVIDRTTLREIIRNGIAPLRPFLEQWTAENLAAEYDAVVDAIRAEPVVDLASNRVLTPRDRERLRPAVTDLKELCPDIMSRKIPDAVFQNAFIFEQARALARREDRIVLIGGYEDPIGPSLQRLGYDVTITDPQLDGRDSDAVLEECLRTGIRYDMVISCSVIEHVEEDLEFLQSLLEMLRPGGVALLTTDFRDGWQPGIAKPTPDVRLYTLERLRMIAAALPEGSLLDAASWRAVPPYFQYDGSDYGFCSIAFRRPENMSERFAAKLMLRKAVRESTARRAAEESVRALTAELERLRRDSALEIDRLQRRLARRPLWKKLVASVW